MSRYSTIYINEAFSKAELRNTLFHILLLNVYVLINKILACTLFLMLLVKSHVYHNSSYI